MALDLSQLAALFGNQQQQAPFDIVGAINALKAPKVAAHYGIGGGQITPDNPMGNAGGDPFSNGFFKHGQQAQPQMSPQQMGDAARLGKSLGFQAHGGRNVGDPFDENGGILPGVNINQPLPTVPLPDPNGQTYLGPTSAMMPGQHMINPLLPDNQKFQDQNFWSAMAPVSKPGIRYPKVR